MRARTFLAAGFIFAAALTSGRARATGAIVSSSSGASSASEVRVAVSSTGTRTSRWVSLRVHGTATPFAWVVPVKPNAFVDLTSDAWLESLEEATAPRVVPPDETPPCGAGGVEVDGSSAHRTTTAPSSVAVAATSEALVTTLDGWGLTVTSDLAPLLDEAGARGDSFVALLYSTASPDVLTRTVRIVDTSPAGIPLGLTEGLSTVAVTAYTFTAGSATIGTAPALTLDPALLLWRQDGTSTYASARDALLASSPGAWLTETAGHEPLFDGETVPGSGGIAPLAPTYFSRAWTYGAATGAPAECSAAASGLAASLSPVAPACPAGALAQVGTAGCQEAPTAGELAPDALRCGGLADDLAVALSGMAPGRTWVTRARSVLEPGSLGTDQALAPDAAWSAGPVWTCSGYGALCTGGSGGPPPPTGGTGSSSGGSGSSSGDGTDPGTASDVGSAAVDVAAAALDASSSDGCSGDSSSGDSCSSDTSGDSSSADGCSGGDSSSSCSVTRTRGRRTPTSRLLLLVVALAAVARRRARA